MAVRLDAATSLDLLPYPCGLVMQPIYSLLGIPLETEGDFPSRRVHFVTAVTLTALLSEHPRAARGFTSVPSECRKWGALVSSRKLAQIE